MKYIILILGIVYFASHALSQIFRKTKIPDVLILMLVGIIAGPVLHVIKPEDFGMVGPVLTTIALIIILFESGLSLDLRILRAAWKPTITITIITFIFTSAATALMAILFFSFSFPLALLLGFILGGTSSAVVIPIVSMIKMKKLNSTILILESVLTDVLCVIFAFGMMSAVKSGEVDAGLLTGNVMASLIMAAVIGFVAAIFWLYILDWIRSFPNTLFTTFAYVFIIYGFTEFFGYSGAISALTFGFAMSNHSRFKLDRLNLFHKVSLAVITDTEKKLFSEMVFLLKTFFFIFLGISIDFTGFTPALLALLIIVIVYTGRLVIIRSFLSRKSSWKEAAYMSVLVPKGLAAAVLAGIPLQMGIPNGDIIQSVTYYVVLFSIITTALAVPAFEIKTVSSFYQSFFNIFSPDKRAISNGNKEEKENNLNDLIQ